MVSELQNVKNEITKGFSVGTQKLTF